jgi:hypothetical protein
MLPEVFPMIAMTSADQVRRVLHNAHRDLVIEELADGGAVVRDPRLAAAAANEGHRFPVSETLSQCANLLADSGFAIAMVRDQQGVYLNAR